MSIGVNFFGPIYTEDGIGEAARLTLKCFQEAGISVAINPLTRPVAREDMQNNTTDFSTPYSINYFHFSSRWVDYYIQIIGKERLSGKYNIAHWLTEVQDYPSEWAKNYKYFNEIWTASSFCQDSISMKLPLPTILIPYPIIGKTVKNNCIESIENTNDFTFLVMANMYSDIERKNVLASLESFIQAFNNSENVRLILKLSNSNIDLAYKEKVDMYLNSDNRIFLLDKFIERDEVNALFQSADAYVSLHRAEGFGLTIGEAMYHEIPVITTAYSGNIDFCNSFNSYLVDYDLVKVGEDRLRYKSSDVWAEPKIDSAVKVFKEVYYNSKDVQVKVRNAKIYIESYFSVKAISEKIKKRLEVIDSKFEFNGSFGEFNL